METNPDVLTTIRGISDAALNLLPRLAASGIEICLNVVYKPVEIRLTTDVAPLNESALAVPAERQTAHK